MKYINTTRVFLAQGVPRNKNPKVTTKEQNKIQGKSQHHKTNQKEQKLANA